MRLLVQRCISYPYNPQEGEVSTVYEGTLETLLEMFPVQDDNPFENVHLAEEKNESQQPVYISYRFWRWKEGEWEELDADPRRSILFS